jgi:GNAT superfamily N-acetyltransferase
VNAGSARRMADGRVVMLRQDKDASGVIGVVATPQEDPGLIIAEARAEPIGASTAELSVTVREGYRGASLGRLLLDALVRRAGDNGIERLRATVRLDNAPMLGLLKHYGWALAAPVADYFDACLEISATGGMPGWPARSQGRRVLVERRSLLHPGQATALDLPLGEVRQCTGPRSEVGRACPLVTTGRCRLAEQADLIVSLLPAEEPECRAVLAAHRSRWPDRLFADQRFRLGRHARPAEPAPHR